MIAMHHRRLSGLFIVLLLFNLQPAFSQNKLSDPTNRLLRVYNTRRILFSERPDIDGRLNDGLNDIFPNNFFLIKFNYWLSI